MEHVCKRCAQLAERRHDDIAGNHGWSVMSSQTSHPNHAGVVVARSKLGGIQAFFYLPGKTRDPFTTEELTSAHGILESFQRVDDKLAHYRKVLHGPHDLSVGDILTESRPGCAFPRTHFVVGLPGPKHVDLIPCPTRMVHSGWEGSTETPHVPDRAWIARHTPTRHKVLMPKGVATIDFGKGWTAQRWNKRPYHTSYDG